MQIIKQSIALFFVTFLLTGMALAGNPDRRGQAGATELLINPWARSSGLHSLNTSMVNGIEATRINTAGLAFSPGTQVSLSHTRWLMGTGITFNSLGISQHTSKQGVLGIDIMAVSFGEFDRTTVSQPGGGLGKINPQFINLGLSYARSFSNSIHGGLTVRAIHQSIADVSATGVALDAGVQYVTGPKDNIKFGISLRNVGTPMRYTGTGLTFRGQAPSGNYDMTQEQRSEVFEMPSLLNIGGSYDFLFQNVHRLTLVGNFTSNSFMNDQMGLGAEYAFKEMFMGRIGYKIEKGLLEENGRRYLAYTGLSAGITANIPLKSKSGDSSENGEEEEKTEEKNETIPEVGIDISYRSTTIFGGTFTVGARVNL